jgi:hypothetical protein
VSGFILWKLTHFLVKRKAKLKALSILFYTKVKIPLFMKWSSFKFHMVGIIDNIKTRNFKGLMRQLGAINYGRKLNRVISQETMRGTNTNWTEAARKRVRERMNEV